MNCQQLHAAARQAWPRALNWYFHPNTTGLFYDHLHCSDHATNFQHLPAPSEIAASDLRHNPLTYCRGQGSVTMLANMNDCPF